MASKALIQQIDVRLTAGDEDFSMQIFNILIGCIILWDLLFMLQYLSHTHCPWSTLSNAQIIKILQRPTLSNLRRKSLKYYRLQNDENRVSRKLNFSRIFVECIPICFIPRITCGLSRFLNTTNTSNTFRMNLFVYPNCNKTLSFPPLWKQTPSSTAWDCTLLLVTISPEMIIHFVQALGLRRRIIFSPSYSSISNYFESILKEGNFREIYPLL